MKQLGNYEVREKTMSCNYGVKIKDRRKSLKLTQKILSKQAEVTQSFISQLETGQRKDVCVSVALRISNALNTTVENLFS